MSTPWELANKWHDERMMLHRETEQWITDLNAAKACAEAAEAALAAMQQRAERAEAALSATPWDELRTVVDIGFQKAQEEWNSDALWGVYERVEAWLDANQMSDESCATIHPEAWEVQS